MSDKQYKLIKENWDNYIKEDQENLEEAQLLGMNLILSNLEHLADFFDFLASPKVLNDEGLKSVANTCRTVNTALKKLKKEDPVVYRMIQAADIVGAAKGAAANKIITAIRSAFGLRAPKQVTQDDDISPEDMEPIEP